MGEKIFGGQKPQKYWRHSAYMKNYAGAGPAFVIDSLVRLRRIERPNY